MNTTTATHKKLFPLMNFRENGWLSVSDMHEIYWEDAGRLNNIPVLCLHGGPGGGSNPEMRRFFDHRMYRTILFDQRGCGKSTPYSEIRENTTWDLVDDIEKLRENRGIDQWIVFGGSWGSTLALAYAIKHPDRVKGLILRGVFLLTDAELNWFYQSGASFLFPDCFERYVKPIPEDERGDLISAFHKRLTSSNREERIEAARAWSQWEGETLSIRSPSVRAPRFQNDRFVDAFARLECHYFKNKGFFEEDGWILKNIEKIQDIPGVIIHGRYDVVTPLSSAWALHKAWNRSQLQIIPNAGHSSLEPGIVDAIIQATENWSKQF